MEYTCMEATFACIVSGAAFHTPSDGDSANGSSGESAWDAWLGALVKHRWSIMPTAKHSIWANVLARALRCLANELVGDGALMQRFGAGRALEAEFIQYTEFLCELAASWGGESSADAKCPLLVHYCLDHLIQVLCRRFSISQAVMEQSPSTSSPARLRWAPHAALNDSYLVPLQAYAAFARVLTQRACLWRHCLQPLAH